jgi:hypothetical protein
LQRSRQLDIDGAKVRYNDQSVWAGVAITGYLRGRTVQRTSG